MIALLLLVGLSTWRLSSLFMYEDGPFAMFARVRGRAGVGTTGELSPLATLFACMWCMSIWVAGVHTGLAYLLDLVDGQQAYFLWLASSTIAIAVNEAIDKVKE